MNEETRKGRFALIHTGVNITSFHKQFQAWTSDSYNRDLADLKHHLNIGENADLAYYSLYLSHYYNLPLMTAPNITFNNHDNLLVAGFERSTLAWSFYQIFSPVFDMSLFKSLILDTHITDLRNRPITWNHMNVAEGVYIDMDERLFSNDHQYLSELRGSMMKKHRGNHKKRVKEFNELKRTKPYAETLYQKAIMANNKKRYEAEISPYEIWSSQQFCTEVGCSCQQYMGQFLTAKNLNTNQQSDSKSLHDAKNQQDPATPSTTHSTLPPLTQQQHSHSDVSRPPSHQFHLYSAYTNQHNPDLQERMTLAHLYHSYSHEIETMPENPLAKHPKARKAPILSYTMDPSVSTIARQCGFALNHPTDFVSVDSSGIHLIIQQPRYRGEFTLDEWLDERWRRIKLSVDRQYMVMLTKKDEMAMLSECRCGEDGKQGGSDTSPTQTTQSISTESSTTDRCPDCHHLINNPFQKHPFFEYIKPENCTCEFYKEKNTLIVCEACYQFQKEQKLFEFNHPEFCCCVDCYTPDDYSMADQGYGDVETQSTAPIGNGRYLTSSSPHHSTQLVSKHIHNTHTNQPTEHHFGPGGTQNNDSTTTLKQPGHTFFHKTKNTHANNNGSGTNSLSTSLNSSTQHSLSTNQSIMNRSGSMVSGAFQQDGDDETDLDRALKHFESINTELGFSQNDMFPTGGKGGQIGPNGEILGADDDNSFFFSAFSSQNMIPVFTSSSSNSDNDTTPGDDENEHGERAKKRVKKIKSIKPTVNSTHHIQHLIQHPPPLKSGIVLPKLSFLPQKRVFFPSQNYDEDDEDANTSINGGDDNASEGDDGSSTMISKNNSMNSQSGTHGHSNPHSNLQRLDTIGPSGSGSLEDIDDFDPFSIFDDPNQSQTTQQQHTDGQHNNNNSNSNPDDPNTLYHSQDGSQHSQHSNSSSQGNPNKPSRYPSYSTQFAAFANQMYGYPPPNGGDGGGNGGVDLTSEGSQSTQGGSGLGSHSVISSGPNQSRNHNHNLDEWYDYSNDDEDYDDGDYDDEEDFDDEDWDEDDQMWVPHNEGDEKRNNNNNNNEKGDGEDVDGSHTTTSTEHSSFNTSIHRSDGTDSLESADTGTKSEQQSSSKSQVDGDGTQVDVDGSTTKNEQPRHLDQDNMSTTVHTDDHNTISTQSTAGISIHNHSGISIDGPPTATTTTTTATSTTPVTKKKPHNSSTSSRHHHHHRRRRHPDRGSPYRDSFPSLINGGGDREYDDNSDSTHLLSASTPLFSEQPKNTNFNQHPNNTNPNYPGRGLMGAYGANNGFPTTTNLFPAHHRPFNPHAHHGFSGGFNQFSHVGNHNHDARPVKTKRQEEKERWKTMSLDDKFALVKKHSQELVSYLPQPSSGSTDFKLPDEDGGIVVLHNYSAILTTARQHYQHLQVFANLHHPLLRHLPVDLPSGQPLLQTQIEQTYPFHPKMKQPWIGLKKRANQAKVPQMFKEKFGYDLDLFLVLKLDQNAVPRGVIEEHERNKALEKEGENGNKNNNNNNNNNNNTGNFASYNSARNLHPLFNQTALQRSQVGFNGEVNGSYNNNNANNNNNNNQPLVNTTPGYLDDVDSLRHMLRLHYNELCYEILTLEVTLEKENEKRLRKSKKQQRKNKNKNNKLDSNKTIQSEADDDHDDDDDDNDHSDDDKLCAPYPLPFPLLSPELPAVESYHQHPALTLPHDPRQPNLSSSQSQSMSTSTITHLSQSQMGATALLSRYNSLGSRAGDSPALGGASGSRFLQIQAEKSNEPQYQEKNSYYTNHQSNLLQNHNSPHNNNNNNPTSSLSLSSTPSALNPHSQPSYDTISGYIDGMNDTNLYEYVERERYELAKIGLDHLVPVFYSPLHEFHTLYCDALYGCNDYSAVRDECVCHGKKNKGKNEKGAAKEALAAAAADKDNSDDKEDQAEPKLPVKHLPCTCYPGQSFRVEAFIATESTRRGVDEKLVRDMCNIDTKLITTNYALPHINRFITKFGKSYDFYLKKDLSRINADLGPYARLREQDGHHDGSIGYHSTDRDGRQFAQETNPPLHANAVDSTQLNSTTNTPHNYSRTVSRSTQQDDLSNLPFQQQNIVTPYSSAAFGSFVGVMTAVSSSRTATVQSPPTLPNPLQNLNLYENHPLFAPKQSSYFSYSDDEDEDDEDDFVGPINSNSNPLNESSSAATRSLLPSHLMASAGSGNSNNNAAGWNKSTAGGQVSNLGTVKVPHHHRSHKKQPRHPDFTPRRGNNQGSWVSIIDKAMDFYSNVVLASLYSVQERMSGKDEESGMFTLETSSIDSSPRDRTMPALVNLDNHTSLDELNGEETITLTQTEIESQRNAFVEQFIDDDSFHTVFNIKNYKDIVEYNPFKCSDKIHLLGDKVGPGGHAVLQPLLLQQNTNANSSDLSTPLYHLPTPAQLATTNDLYLFLAQNKEYHQMISSQSQLDRLTLRERQQLLQLQNQSKSNPHSNNNQHETITHNLDAPLAQLANLQVTLNPKIIPLFTPASNRAVLRYTTYITCKQQGLSAAEANKRWELVVGMVGNRDSILTQAHMLFKGGALANNTDKNDKQVSQFKPIFDVVEDIANDFIYNRVDGILQRVVSSLGLIPNVRVNVPSTPLLLA